MSHSSTVAELWRLPQVMAATGLGRSTIFAWLKQDRFPKQIKLSHRVVAWRSADVLAWIEDKEKAAAQQ